MCSSLFTNSSPPSLLFLYSRLVRISPSRSATCHYNYPRCIPRCVSAESLQRDAGRKTGLKFSAATMRRSWVSTIMFALAFLPDIIHVPANAGSAGSSWPCGSRHRPRVSNFRVIIRSLSYVGIRDRQDRLGKSRDRETRRVSPHNRN